MSIWDLAGPIRQRISEENGILRKPASLKIALCHPAPYLVAMSSLGFQTIYREIHQHPGASAERAFLPENIAEYRRSRTPVFSYEGETPLSEFPIVAFSIAYELELTGLLEMLDLSGIPVLRQDRNERHPLVIAGGPLTASNPAIMAPFIDLIILGEGEELIHGFLDAAAETATRGLPDRFSGTPGCYAPGLTAKMPGLARIDDTGLPAYSQILTKNTVLASMFLIEPERGCSRNCAYCVMRRTSSRGMRPVSPEKVIAHIPENARRVGLVGAAVTDHPQIRELVDKIVAGGREIGISSLQADRLDEELVHSLARGGYRSLTTALDGASQRLRDLMNRHTAEKHLIRAAELVRDAGLQRMKLYVMLGLPGEKMDDVDELIRFCIELSKITPLSLSISPFVAKRNTPLDGAGFEPIPLLTEKLSKTRRDLKNNVAVRESSIRWAWVEYMLSQGDETAGLAAMDAWRAGGSFSSWKKAFSRRGIEAFQRPPLSGGAGKAPETYA